MCFMNELAHVHWRLGDHVFEASCNQPTDTSRLAAVVAERMFVEVGLQML